MPVGFASPYRHLVGHRVAVSPFTSGASAGGPTSNAVATGGTITVDTPTLVEHTFTTAGTFSLTNPGVIFGCEVLVVAGGGGGGARRPGGGGGGGEALPVTLDIGADQTVTVGAGGAGGDGSSDGTNDGTKGGNSVFGASTAEGGGFGAGGDAAGPDVGGDGGTGGGGGGSNDSGTSAGGTASGSGGDGGSGVRNTTGALASGGGGGGAGAGNNGTNGSGGTAGDGGDGYTWTAGDGNTYGGGGGGGGGTTSGSGGTGGGGNGSTGSDGSAGTDGLGGGGGGTATTGAGGAGGSGVVIVRYNPANFYGALATGGTIEGADDGYVYHTFTTAGTFSLTNPGILPAEVLVVGGGGGGGSTYAGGGGGGEALAVTTDVIADQTVTVGAGGAGGTGTGGAQAAGSNGGDSVFGATTATGGGGGGPGGLAVAANMNGEDGGNGGGGGAGDNVNTGAGGTGDQFDGGDPTATATAADRASGGGGGAGAVGANASAGVGGDGGAGIEWPTSSGEYYGGGGGGGVRSTTTAGAGGVGGGGDGGETSVDPTAGTDGRGGGGGGGGGVGAATYVGADGGDGVVIVRYDPRIFVASYQALLESQGATSYWSLDTARSVSATESDLIGAVDLTMTGGGSAADTSTMRALPDAIAVVDGDTEGYVASNSHDPDSNWSVSGWVKLTSTGAADIIFTVANNNTGSDYFYIIHRSDRSGVTCQMYNAGNTKYVDFADIDDGGWHHLCATRAYSATAADDTITTYVDGQQVNQQNRATVNWPTNITADNFTIGNRDGVDIGITGSLRAWAFAEGVTWTAQEVFDQYARGTAAFPSVSATPLFWLDADDADTVTDAGSGAVSQWDDKGSAGADVTQGTAANRPTTGTRTLNGRNLIDFDGTNDVLSSSGTVGSSTDATLFAVFVPDDVASPAVILEQSANANTNEGLYLVHDDDGTLDGEVSTRFHGSTVSGTLDSQKSWSSSLLVNSTAALVVAEHDGTHAGHLSWLNGTQQTTSSSQTGLTDDTGSVAINDTMHVGDRSGGGVAPFDGAVGELVLFDGVLTTAQREAVQFYLAGKWGITLP